MNNNTDKEIKQEELAEQAALPKEEAKIPPHKEYGARMSAFKEFYNQLLICVGIGAAAGIVVAVVYNVIIGACIAVVSALAYSYLVYDKMFRSLGVGYTVTEGGIEVKRCVARYGDVIWLPSALINFEIVKISDKAFRSAKNAELKRVFLPRTLKKIGEDIFEGCEAMIEIYFEGTSEEWENIEKATDLSSYRIIFEAKYPPIPKKKKKNNPVKK